MQSFQVIEETPQYCVETFGPSLPVLITEVLLQADRSANISVKLDNSGWACLVCDRRLFIWRYKQTQAARIGMCYQLALPATELCHRADLTCLIPTGGGSSGANSQMVSVLAVSPEGVVRYWPTAHREIAYSERSLELAGQECFSLTAFGKHQCILATTTNQLMMISVSPSTMQSQVEVHTLKSSQGMIARVSSFLFGAQKDETSGLRRVLAGSAEASGYPLYILQDSVLQKWFISGPGQEQVVYEKQLDGLFKQQFQKEMVSKIEDIVEALMEEEQDLLSSGLTPQDTVSLISSINSIIQSILQEGSIPWIASSGPRGIRMLLVQQHNLTVGRAIANAEDAQSRSSLFQQLQGITDLLLNGYIAQLESSNKAEGEDSLLFAELEQRYTQERTALISPFLEHSQFEKAAVLAEKYCDFAILVELCESETGRKDRLQYYMDKFSNKGFSDFVFKYYIDRGQRGKLLTHFAHRPELSEFLQPHDHLGWLQDIHTSNYSQAQDTLRKLAARESFSVSKKKTLLSLGKLAALASDNDHQREISEINADLDIITHHEQLPRDVIQKLNLNEVDLPCMTPQQLIELVFVQDGSQYSDLRLRIWCRAILRDEWNEMQGVDPWDYFKDSIFFKTAAKARQEGLNLIECLPDPDALLQHYELDRMRDNAQFQYLLRTGFEQIGRSLAAAE
nr:nuclear pore complex protein Nup133-like [Lytechinus pictus]